MSQIAGLLNGRIALCIFAPLSFFYLLIGFNQGQDSHYDEGLCVYGAARVLNGELPYRDFWTIYAPAQFFVLAGFFKLFGALLIVERILSAIILFLLLAVIYLIARNLALQRVAWIAWFLALVWIGSCRLFASPMPLALLFSLLSLLCILNFLSQRRRLWLILGGLSVGAAALFRHDIGFYTFLSETLVAVPFIFRNLTSNEMSVPHRCLGVMKLGFPYLLGITALLLPVLIWFTSVMPLKELVYDLVVFPLTIFPKVRSVAYPAPIPNPVDLFNGALSPFRYASSILNRLPYYFPLLVYAAVGVIIMIQIFNRRIDWGKPEIWKVILLTLLGIIFFNQARIRPDALHLIPTFIPAAILLAVLLSNIPKIRPFRQALGGLAFLLCLSLVIKPMWLKVRAASDFFSPGMFSFGLDRAKGISYPQEEATHVDAIGYIQGNVPVPEKIFVGNTRHDRIFVNDIMFYFLCNRHSATKYHELHPGLATTATVQEKIVSEIEAQRVRYVVLRAESEQELNETGASSGAKILDNFIREKFAVVREFGRYSVWERKVC